jgi:hypothetical protein
MGLIIKTIILLFIILACLTSISIAAWQGPAEIVTGGWGSGETQFGYKSGDTFDQFPQFINISSEGNIVITDGQNGRFKLYSSNGQLLRNITPPLENPKDWVINPKFVGSNIVLITRYYFFFSLSGEVISSIDAQGKVVDFWDTINNKLYIKERNPVKWEIYSATGNLLQTMNERPPELGAVTRKSLGGGKYRYKIEYPEQIISVETNEIVDRFLKDSIGRVNGIAKVDSGDEYCTYQVSKYSSCGKILDSVKMPTTRFEPPVIERREFGVFEGPRRVIEEYGKPVISPNGDLYTWKRTPDTYSILKWTWQDDPKTKDLAG